jgi:hypothetical protein
MAIKYYGGNKITGVSGDTKPTLTTDMKGASFFETNTDDLYIWDGDSWNIVAGNTLIQDLSNKTFTDYLLVEERSAPGSSVGSGKGAFYVDSSGVFYGKFENATPVNLGVGAGASTLAALTDTTIGSLPSSGTTGHILVYDNSNSWDNKLLAGVAAGGAGECVISITNAGLVGIDSLTGLANSGTVLDVVSAGGVSIFPTLGTNTLSVGATASTVNILGNLTVSGVTTTVDTTNLLVEDPLIVISKAQTGTASVDSGFVVERGNDQNVGLIWDESTNTFVFINTDEVGTTAGNVTIASYAPMKAAAIEGTVGLLTTSLETRGKLLIDTAAFNITIGADGHLFHIDAQTLTDNTTSASGTASANFSLVTIDQPTLAATNASTTTIASTVYIANAPAAGTNETLTNAYALYVAAGTVKFVGGVEQGATTLASLIVTGNTDLQGDVNLGDATGDDISIIGYVDTSIIPKTDSTSDLGTAALQWRVAYIDTIGETGDGATLVEPRFANGGFIADSGGNQQIIFTTTGSAVNEITIANAASGGAPSIIASGETNVHLKVSGKGSGGVIVNNFIADTNGAEEIIFTTTGSAINEFTVANAAADGSPTLSVTGGDTDVALTLKSKGADGIIVAGSTDNGAFLEFQQKAAPGDPSLEYARLYLKQVDAQNNALAVKLQKANTIQEVEITSPKAICGECGSTDGAKDPTYDFSRSMMVVELWCGHAYEVPMTGWNMVS